MEETPLDAHDASIGYGSFSVRGKYLPYVLIAAAAMMVPSIIALYQIGDMRFDLNAHRLSVSQYLFKEEGMRLVARHVQRLVEEH